MCKEMNMSCASFHWRELVHLIHVSFGDSFARGRHHTALLERGVEQHALRGVVQHVAGLLTYLMCVTGLLTYLK